MREDSAVRSLLERAAAGDREAAGELVLQHEDRLRRVIRLRLDARVARRVDVDDVLQEMRAEAFERLPEFLAAQDVTLLVWLRFLAIQRCVTLARRHLAAAARDVRREAPLPGADAGDSTSMALERALSAHVTTPSRAAAREEVGARLGAAVRTLEPFDREILCLRHFEQLDNGEAAAVLGVPPATASKRYVRALGRLRVALSQAGVHSPSF